jgi:hypothetical protein
MTTRKEALEALDYQIKLHDQLNDGVEEPVLSRRESLKVITLSVKEAKEIRAALSEECVWRDIIAYADFTTVNCTADGRIEVYKDDKLIASAVAPPRPPETKE